MLVNASLGTVLWGTYGEASSRLEPYLASHSLSNSAFSGAIAGACQAVVAAPAENVRLLLEGGFGGHSWSCAWKEVFREKRSPLTAATQLNEIRQLRNWFQEVGQMAGRGWEGWGWGCAKDATGQSEKNLKVVSQGWNRVRCLLLYLWTFKTCWYENQGHFTGLALEAASQNTGWRSL